MNSGLIIADRYVLVSPLDLGLPGCESWLATDTRLGAEVTVLMSDDRSRRAFWQAAEPARAARHARLARVIEVGLLDSDESDLAGRPFAVLERPEGLSVEDLVLSRILPTPVARALVGEAALAVEAAAALGLRHGAISAGSLVVTPNGRVILSGVGIAAGLIPLESGGRAVSERDDALALARLFVMAITGLDPSEALPENLPVDLTRMERDLAFVVSGAGGRPALADLFRVFKSWNRDLLRSLALRRLSFPRRPQPEVPTPEPEIAVPTGVGMAEASGRMVPGASPLAVEAEAREYVEVDDWAFDELEDVSLLEEVPSVSEAILGFLNRKFPSQNWIARLQERARSRTLAGPRFDSTPWLLLGSLVVLVIIGILSLQWLRSPFVPSVDLNNNPSQEYPEFTFGPSPTP